MDKNKLHKLQKKASAQMNNTMTALITGLIVVVLALLWLLKCLAT